MRLAVIIAFLSVSVTVAADLADKWQKRIDTAQAAYNESVAKAENTFFYAKQKANADRLKVLRQVLTDATKAGDFDAAMSVKALVTAAEEAGATRPKPKNVVKFGGHEYALIEEKVTWHVAKKRCEEMGGNLACMESQDELNAIRSLCVSTKLNAWLGASDEESEGDWKWITGKSVQFAFRHDNSGDAEHYLAWYGGSWEDIGDTRFAFVCEWDN